MYEPARAGLANARDVGGLPLIDGGRVKSGVLFRSDGPLAGEPDPDLTPWPPTTVIDLREAAEMSSDHPLTRDGVVVHSVPLLAAAATVHQAESFAMPESADLVALYSAMVDNGGAMIAEVARLVAASDGPNLIHCAVGKDRTGVAIAIILSASGVARADIVTDYELTGPNMPAVLDRYRARSIARSENAEPFDFAQLPAGLLDTNTAAIDAVLDAVEGHHRGAAGWLLAHGLTEDELRALRERLVDAEE